MRFTFKANDFLLDGKPVQIISGAFHYFRTLPQMWDDILKKIRAFGCNSVETYMPWNLHEPSPGRFDFSGLLDVERFFNQVQENELFLILRPGPYICAEWEGGGLPAWLLKQPGTRVRCYNQYYLESAERYLARVCSLIDPYQIDKGGPIIMVQLENEYGFYGNDHKYMAFLHDLYKRAGIKTLLFTSDNPTVQSLKAGTLENILETVNFGSDSSTKFDILHQHQVNRPDMCTEFWCGWFDTWGGEHHRRSPQDVADNFEEIIKSEASINVYMFHGGTNFGFTSGANYDDQNLYQPVITSYDYGAFLAENGDITEKYLACRKVLSKYRKLPPLPDFIKSRTITLPKADIIQAVSLFDYMEEVSQKQIQKTPLPMEDLDQASGFINYSRKIPGPWPEAKLRIKELRDRAIILVNRKPVKTIYRNDAEQTVRIDFPLPQNRLDILVENMGRINFGLDLLDRKGITRSVSLDGIIQFDWEVYCLPLDNPEQINFKDSGDEFACPGFFLAEPVVKEQGDTYIDMSAWVKGNVFINGFNIGRYWQTGPQKTLYVPAGLLQQGLNRIIIFELHPDLIKNKKIIFKDRHAWS